MHVAYPYKSLTEMDFRLTVINLQFLYFTIHIEGLTGKYNLHLHLIC
jgi:hypothetical protein